MKVLLRFNDGHKQVFKDVRSMEEIPFDEGDYVVTHRCSPFDGTGPKEGEYGAIRFIDREHSLVLVEYCRRISTVYCGHDIPEGHGWWFDGAGKSLNGVSIQVVD